MLGGVPGAHRLLLIGFIPTHKHISTFLQPQPEAWSTHFLFSHPFGN